MSFAERLTAAKPQPKPSGFLAWVAALNDEDRAALEAAAVDPAWNTRALLDFVKSEGAAASRDTVTKWRRDLGFPG